MLTLLGLTFYAIDAQRRWYHTCFHSTPLSSIQPTLSIIAAICGATLLDKLGRRVMLLGGIFGSLASCIMPTAFTA
jgi:hypothetical protein